MPKARIDGTQRPIKIAAFASPLKYNISEKMSERNAEINNNLSVMVNLVNIFVFGLKFFSVLKIKVKINQFTLFCFYEKPFREPVLKSPDEISLRQPYKKCMHSTA